MFKEIFIIGLGFMGASIASAVRKSDKNIKILGYDINSDNLDFCVKNNLIDSALDLELLHGYGSPKEFSRYSGTMVLFAAPPKAILSILNEFGTSFKKFSLITDISSVKEFILNNEKIKELGIENFVGSHPMCGSDKTGPENFDENLLNSKNCIIIKDDAGKENTERLSKIETVASFWKMLGMRIFYATPEFHDRMAAFTSHLPHLVSFALSGTVMNEVTKKQDSSSREFISGGFIDSTRIAASSAVLWSDIFMQNRKNLLASLKEFISVLDNLKDALENSDVSRLTRLLSEISEERRNL